MATERQLEANRRNAQLSTGPRTQDGKEASKLNAIRHGLRAREGIVLPHEDAEAYHAKVEAWMTDLAPRNAAEEHLVRHAADISWKIDRADRYEVAQLTRRMEAAMQECDDQSEDARQEAAILASFDPSMEGERLRRYQSSLSRELLRTIEALAKLRREEERALKNQISRSKGANEAKSPRANEPKSPRANEPNAPAPIEANSQAPIEPISNGAAAISRVEPSVEIRPSEPNSGFWYGAVLEHV